MAQLCNSFEQSHSLTRHECAVCGIVTARQPTDFLTMPQQLISISQTAERLRVRPDYVRELVKKKRLTFIHGEQFDAAEVEKLAELMDKLRANGIATLVNISGEGGDVD